MRDVMLSLHEVLKGLSSIFVAQHVRSCGKDDVGDVASTPNLCAVLFAFHLGGLAMISQEFACLKLSKLSGGAIDSLLVVIGRFHAVSCVGFT